MTGRIKFRWLLPVVMTAAQVVLFAMTAAQERAASEHSALSIGVAQAAAIQEDQTVTFQPMYPKPIPASSKAASVLNLPALFGGVVLAPQNEQKRYQVLQSPKGI